MLMSSRSLLYLVVVLSAWLLWRTLPFKDSRQRQVLMLLVSYLLYASWGLSFLGLLILSSLFNFAWGGYLRKSPTVARLWVGIGTNVAILSTFKYLPSILFLWPNSTLHSALAGILLPVGISFWTFQAISYLFDVYREEEAQPTLVEFLLYMAFWPTVLSGPINRLPRLIGQFSEVRKPVRTDLLDGMDRIFMGVLMIGLGYALSSGLQDGQGLEQAFNRGDGEWTGLDVWCLAVGYGFELFFNFAGYSHIVIGAARLFGYVLDENFARPYLSRSPSEFWTRWHMSLSFWIRDYLFLPVAMLRRERWWRHVALLSSMLAFGLWHKGSVLFALWGLYHGILLVAHRQWQHLQRRFDWRFPGWTIEPLGWIFTFSSICLGWILFRANNLEQALKMLRATVTPHNYFAFLIPEKVYWLVLASVLGYFAVIGAEKLGQKLFPDRTLPMELRVAFYSAAIYLGALHQAQSQAFIYFQF